MRFTLAAARRMLRQHAGALLGLALIAGLTLSGVAIGVLAHRAAQQTSANQPGPHATVVLCGDRSAASSCSAGAATAAQRSDVDRVLGAAGAVRSHALVPAAAAASRARTIDAPVQSGPAAFADSYDVTLTSPRQYDALTGDVDGLPGVDRVVDRRTTTAGTRDDLRALRWGAAGVAVLGALLWTLLGAAVVRGLADATRHRIAIARDVGATARALRAPLVLAVALPAVLGAALAGGASVAAVTLGEGASSAAVAALGRLDGGDVVRTLPWIVVPAVLAGVWPGAFSARRRVRA